MTSGPVAAMVLQRPKAIYARRKVMGKSFCTDAEPGTIRGDLGVSRGMNLVHGSDGPDAAKKEIELFSKADELLEYKRAGDAWVLNDEDRA